MKRLIGIILLILLFGGLFVGMTVSFHYGGLSWVNAILSALGVYVTTALITATVCLAVWLLT